MINIKDCVLIVFLLVSCNDDDISCADNLTETDDSDIETVDNYSWRSTLYPEDWAPGFKDNEGRFLHDFSYAGYHSGLKVIPYVIENIKDITKSPYNADNSGSRDVTSIVQKAIDDVSDNGGGVIFFPEGEYLLSVSSDKKEGLRIASSNIILRGAGEKKTFIKNTTTMMREKILINFQPFNASWRIDGADIVKLSADIIEPTKKIPVTSVANFKKGDLILIKTDCTDEFIKEHKSEGMWSQKISGLSFCRYITDVDNTNNIITVDVPTRYYMKIRDNARIFKLSNQLEECGIENLSICNLQNVYEGDWGDENGYNNVGTGPYNVHASHLINFSNSINCWVKNICTYRPSENSDDIHVLSNCLQLLNCRGITVTDCNFQKSQYEGGGGNGYMYTLYDSNDCLITKCHAEHGRHNYDFKGFSSNGNVIHKCTSKDPRYSSDFHMWLSMANLFDCFESDGDYLEASFRPWGDKDYVHSYSTTESVYWNIKGNKPHKVGYLVESRQWKWGYVIGTSGQINNVVTTPLSGAMDGYGIMRNYDTYPEDFVEGVGKGDFLIPQSLYEDQLWKRIKRSDFLLFK